MESHGRINSRPHSSSLLPAGSSGRFGSIEGSAHSDPSSVRYGPGPCVPPRYPTAGTSVVPLVLRCLGAGELPSRLAVSCGPSDLATWFSSPGFLPSSGASTSQQWRQLMPMSCERITVLLAKDVMKPVPPADMKAGFFSPYIIVPKKSSGLRPILGLHILNWAFHKPPFKMLTQKCIFGCIHPRDRSAAVDLKDPYFHVSIFPHHRSILRFVFEGRAYHYKVLPFGLSLLSRVFTKVAEAALVPLREHGARILNYLDDWLILAPSQDQLCEHRDLVLSHLSQSGLRVNWEKSKLSPMQRISFLGMELDSVNQTVRLTKEHAQSVLNCSETVSEAPGAYGGGSHATGAVPYEIASTLAPWPSPEVAWQRGTLWVPSHSGLPPNLHPVVRPFVSSGKSVPETGLQAGCGLHGCLRQGLGGHVQRACSVGGLDGSPTALAHQLPRVAGSTPGLEPSQEVLTRRAGTGPHGQHCNRCVHQPTRWSTLPSQLARHLLLWSPKHLKSLRAIHIPGLLNRAANELSQTALPGEWKLHPQMVHLIWRCFGLAQVYLFASSETSHCQLFYSLTEGTLGTDALAHSWLRGLCKYAFPLLSLLAQTLCKIREDEEQILLVVPYWPTRTWIPELMLLVTAPPWSCHAGGFHRTLEGVSLAFW